MRICITFFWLSYGGFAFGQAPAPRFTPFYDRPNLLVYRDEKGALAPIQTAKDWLLRRQQSLVLIQSAMGPFPSSKKTAPLEIKVLAVEDRPKYTRTALTYVSEPGDRTPAFLLTPKDIKPNERRPAVLALHQTTGIGKKEPAGMGLKNLAYGHELAERGYVVLIPDYPSFGDYPYDFDSDRHISGTMKGILNHSRGVDLLVARNDVDPNRIGVIGHSLGGHNSLFVAVFDPRIRVVVTSCGWCPFHYYYKGKISGWTSSRYIPRLRDEYRLDPNRVPFDFYELIACIAPRAVFSNSPIGDNNFEVEGVKKAEAAIQKVYNVLDAKDRWVVRYPTCGHDFPPEIREESYRFMDANLKVVNR